MLGVGDVVLPGMLIVIAGRAGKLAGTPWLHRAAIAGYGVGLAACLTVATTTGAPLPALVFLVPGPVIAVVLAAWRAHAWPALASAWPPHLASIPASTGDLAASPP
jgi:presenilin-like A22 family membrane protease